jgi:hypothetical protein
MLQDDRVTSRLQSIEKSFVNVWYSRRLLC